MSNETQAPTEEKSGPNIWRVVLIILGALVVVLLIVLLARAIGGGEDVSGPEVIPPPPDTSGPYVEANTYVNVRSGPSTSFPSYGVAPPGATAPVTGVSPDGGWWQILAPTDVVPTGQGWVSAEYVTAYNTQDVPVVQPPPLPPEVIPPTPPPDAPTVTALTAINVRSGPSTNYPSYGVAPQGTTFLATGISPDGGWYQVQVPTQYVASGLAWVSADYVAASNSENLPVVQPPPPPDEIPIPTPPPGIPSITTIEPLNVRSGPGTNYPSYGVAPAGTTLPAIGISPDGEWYVVQVPVEYVPEGQGWVKGAYVTTSNTENLPVAQPPPPP